MTPTEAESEWEVADHGKIYVASRASVPARSAMWRSLRTGGWLINSSWIDEAGEGETNNFTDLWGRIECEIAAADKLVLYAEPDDFPLKGAILEAGIALGMGKPVIVCLPGVTLDGRTMRPIGSWLAHRNVVRCDDVIKAMKHQVRADAILSRHVGAEPMTAADPDAWMREDGSAATVNPMIAGGWKGQGMTVVPLYARTAAQSAEVRERTIEECAKIAGQHATETEVANSDKDAVRIYNMARDEAAFAIRALAQAGGSDEQTQKTSLC